MWDGDVRCGMRATDSPNELGCFQPDGLGEVASIQTSFHGIHFLVTVFESNQQGGICDSFFVRGDGVELGG